jgi:putative CocE/NonD family hydrolase
MKLRYPLVLALVALVSVAAPASAAPPVLPEPTYPSVVAQEVLIPMDDGVQIAATVAFPSKDGSTPAPGRFPVVLSMTPYGRNGLCGCPPAEMFATRGIISVVADVRGTGGSGGTLKDNYFSPREARDTAAVIEHLAVQPYANGKVAMAGGSYVGITQYLAAELQPPHLVAIAPQVAISDLYRDGFAHGGIPNLNFDVQYIGVQGAPGTVGANTDPSLLEATLDAKLGQSPPGTIALDYLARPNDDEFYRDRSPIFNADRIKVPVLDIGGWRDGLLRGATEMYTALARRKGVETRLYVDPCTHKGCGAPLAPLTDPPGRLAVDALIFEFLSTYLLDTPKPDRPPVQLYLQNANTYVDADRWPPTGTRYRRYGLGAGTLAVGASTPATATQSFVTNPLAGFSMAFDRFGTVAATPYVPTDQRLEGPQGLTFRTDALDAPTRLIGPMSLHLVASSSATETDWHAKLADVAPDGTESIITDGALRASHRALDASRSTPERPYHPHTNPEPLEPGRFYDFDIEIWPTAYELPAGHRLQLRITSTDLPTHLPGTYHFDAARPQDTRVELNPPALNTVRLAESSLLVPVAGSPDPPPAAAPAPRRCKQRQRFKIRLRGKHLVRARVTVGGRRAVVRRRRGRLYAIVDLRSHTKPRVVVRVTARTRGGKLVRERRTYMTCRPGT